MRVSVLGQLSVTDDSGIAVPAGELPRRARQVLAVLAARHGKIQSKDALGDAVWGADLPGNHVAALEHYVSVIRRRLQPTGSAATWFIVTRGGGYLFDTGRSGLDLADLRALIRSLDALAPGDPHRLAVHSEILALARELPFPEDPYAEWAEAARSEVQFAAVVSLLELSGNALAGDPPRALRLAQEAIEMSPFLESAYEAAMTAAVAMERPDEALRLYERCRRLLDEELGVPPSAEIIRLQRAIVAGRAATTPVPTPVRPPAGPAPKPTGLTPERFLGRAALIALLFDPGPPRVLHVVGPDGAGKSAFLAELTRHAPGRVGVGHGGSSTGVFRLAWLRTALVELRAGPDVLAAVDAATPDTPLSRTALELIATALDGPEPVFIAVDDAVDLDAAGVSELAWLSRHCPALQIVLTYCYPSQLAGRPLAGLRTAVVMRLSPLTAKELEPLRDDTVLDRTGGIPALVAVAHRPAEVAAAVAMQIARLRTRWMPAPAWEVLRLCAALGPLSAADLVALTGHPMGAVLDCIDNLVHAHLLGESPGGQVRHRSSMIRDAVAEQVSNAAGEHLRSRLAAAS